MHRGHTWHDCPWPWVSLTWLLYNLQRDDVLGADFENSSYIFGQSEKREWVECVIILLIIYQQGMGYLHARGIVHTDLRSKNVFLESYNRVVITDFGLFSVAGLTTKSVRPGFLMIPQGWLPYLAPEILRSLTTQQDAPDSSQFTMATDMYAFG